MSTSSLKYTVALTAVLLSGSSWTQGAHAEADLVSLAGAFPAQTMLELLLSWGEKAHNQLLDYAFDHPWDSTYHVGRDCLRKMKEGSQDADNLTNQVETKAFMHAMVPATVLKKFRGDALKARAVAQKMMFDYIDDEYQQARKLKDAMPDLSCFHRGRALHPIMDSTSPIHGGFAIYEDPFSLAGLAKLIGHGDWDVPGFPSREGPYVLDENPQLIAFTAELMRELDSAKMRN